MIATKEFAAPAPEMDNEEPEQTTSTAALATEEDLASRLAALGGDPNIDLISFSHSPVTEVKTFDPPPAPVVAEETSAPAENSLIARIKAAQQAKKEPQPPPHPEPAAPTSELASPTLRPLTPPPQEAPPPPFSSAMQEAIPPPSAFFAAPPLAAKEADFDLIDHPPPPVFEAPVISAPPITPVQTQAAPPLTTTTTAEPPPPTFEQFLGNMSTEPIQATSYPSLASLPPEPVVHQALHQSSTRVEEDTSSLDMSDAAIAQQREIMEQIERSKNGSRASAPAPASTSSSSSAPLTTQHEITPGNNVTLYSQDATKKAVEEGTAHLVKCLSCSGWMQVIKSATLVFCPNCQVISPVSAENSKELNAGSASMVSTIPGETNTASPTSTSASTVDDAALAAMLQSQFDEEDAAESSSTSGTSSRSIMPDILRRNQPLTAEQRREHIASLTPSQRALHGFEEPEARRLMPVNVGTEMQNMPARETQSAGMLSCLKSGVESAGTAVRDSFSGMNFLGRKSGGGYPGSEGAVLLSNLGDNSDTNYALLEEDDL